MGQRWGPLCIEGCPVPVVGPLVLTCAARVRNCSDQRQLLVVLDPHGDTGGTWQLAPGQTVFLHTPPSGAWRVQVAPVAEVREAVTETGAAVLVVGAVLLAAAFGAGDWWAGRKGGQRHGR
ncbi:MAG: hypothetical protein OWV35_00855 [Firmicutes bacterium]|nr:hypothetical protein [Bacillota bacterium]